jgi:hypothetical protein
MYDFLSEKSLRLAIFYGIGGTFILAIRILFARASDLNIEKKRLKDIYE